MGAPVLNGPFTMPMFRNFVPRKLQPWLYIFIAVTFQLSGGLYMANLSHMVSETSLMREDLQMCLYCNLAGMAVYFPILFRMKFRFTNKTLLTAASLGGYRVQPHRAVHHLSAAALDALLHRGHLQDSGYLRGDVDHPAVDDTQA